MIMQSAQTNNIQPKKPKRTHTCARPPYTFLFECGNCGKVIKMNDDDEGIIKQCDKCRCYIDWN